MSGPDPLPTAVWRDTDDPTRTVLPVAFELLEHAGVRARWQVVEPGAATPVVAACAAGLLPPFDGDPAHRFRLARAARRAWGAAFTVIDRSGVRLPSGDRLDLLVIRYEGDLSDTGLEFPPGSDELSHLRVITTGDGSSPVADQAAVGVQTARPRRIAAFARHAARWCLDHGIRHVTVAHKGNSIKHTDGLFALTVADELTTIAASTGLTWQSLIIDHMAAELVRDPGRYPAVLTHSSFADLLAALVDGQLAQHDRGTCVSVGPDDRPLFGHDPALDVAGAAVTGAADRLDRLLTTLTAGAALAGHLRHPAGAEAVRDAVWRVTGRPQPWDDAVAELRHLIGGRGRPA